MKFPKKIRVGGQTIEVILCESIEDGKLGCVTVASGIMKIAKTFKGEKQSDSCQQNTFWHEVTHCVLDTMGRQDLSNDEVFVNTFASFLNEVMVSIEESYE